MTTRFALQIELSEKLYRELRQAAANLEKSEAEIATDALQSYLAKLQAVDPLLGLFANEAELMDRIAADALQSRERTPWRASESGRG